MKYREYKLMDSLFGKKEKSSDDDVKTLLVKHLLKEIKKGAEDEKKKKDEKKSWWDKMSFMQKLVILQAAVPVVFTLEFLFPVYFLTKLLGIK